MRADKIIVAALVFAAACASAPEPAPEPVRPKPTLRPGGAASESPNTAAAGAAARQNRQQAVERMNQTQNSNSGPGTRTGPEHVGAQRGQNGPGAEPQAPQPPARPAAPAQPGQPARSPADTARDLEGVRGGLQERFSLANRGALLTMVSDDEERELGRAVAARVAAGGLVQDGRITRYVSLVGAVVAEASSRPEIPYRFAVLADDGVNALSTPGGYIFVTRGLLEACADEAELAAALAHEVGHVALRHGLKQLDGDRDRLRKQLAMKALDQAVEEFYGPMDPATKQLIKEMETCADGCWAHLTGGRGQAFEFEADAFAVEVLAKSGYDTGALGSLLARLGAAEGRQSASARAFSTHPPASERAARVKPLAARYGSGGARNAERYARSIGR